METKIERKYALTKIDSGDYLLPSNDRGRLWRISSYWDGPSYGLDEWPRDRKMWSAALYIHPFESRYLATAAFKTEHLDEPSYWIEEAGTFDTRQAAIDYAMDQEKA